MHPIGAASAAGSQDPAPLRVPPRPPAPPTARNAPASFEPKVEIPKAKRSRSGLRLDARINSRSIDGSSSDLLMDFDGDYVTISVYKHKALRSLFKNKVRKSLLIRFAQGNPPLPLLPEPEKPLQPTWIKLFVGSSIVQIYAAGFRIYRCGAGESPPRRLSSSSQYCIQSEDEGQLIAAFRASAYIEVDCFEFSLGLNAFVLDFLYVCLILLTQVSLMRRTRIKTPRPSSECHPCDRLLGFSYNFFFLLRMTFAFAQVLCLCGSPHCISLSKFWIDIPSQPCCWPDQVPSSGRAVGCTGGHRLSFFCFFRQDDSHSEWDFYCDILLSHRASFCKWQVTNCVLMLSARADEDDDLPADDDPVKQFSDYEPIASLSSPPSSVSDVVVSPLCVFIRFLLYGE